MSDEKGLQTIREQLTCMCRLMREAPDAISIGKGFAGRMPAFPSSFTPDGWQQFHTPIWDLWRDYLALVDQQIIELHAYRESVRKLPVADLLAASKEESEKWPTKECL